ncbi:MAG: tetratricopeptide repeat protein [Geobacter sp.]|nr:tetratricopeptide repeat protein [Geobacter sp.]
MKQQVDDEAEREFELARDALHRDDAEDALPHLEKALELRDEPSWYSYVGYCIAKGRGEFKMAVDLCRMSIETEPENPVHYLNLGKVHLAAGNKKKAHEAFREGLEKGGDEEVLHMLVGLGMRNPPVIKSLPRSHPLNRLLGRLLYRHAQRQRGQP